MFIVYFYWIVLFFFKLEIDRWFYVYIYTDTGIGMVKGLSYIDRFGIKIVLFLFNFFELVK